MTGWGAIGRAYLRHRKGRTILTGLGIVLGVAVLFGVLISNATLQDGVDSRRREFSGQADVGVRPIGPWGTRLTDAVVDQVRALPDVTATAATVRVGATSDDGSALTLVGADDEAPVIGEWRLAGGRVAGPGALEVIHTVGHGPGVGATIPVVGATGRYDLTVVGVLEDRGIGEIADSTVRVTSLVTARRIGGERDGVDEVRAVLAAGVDRERWLDDHELEVAGAQMFDATTGSLGGFEIRQSLVFVSAMALFIAAFLIYLTLSGAIVERTAVYGTMRALGATRRQVTRVVVREALWLGSISSVVGLGVGVGVGSFISSAMTDIEGLDSASLSVPPVAAVVSLVIGTVVAAVAAWVPARRAGRLEPAVAMRGDIAGRARLSRAWIAGGVLVVVGSVGQATVPFPMNMLPLIVTMIGLVLLVPLVLGPLAAMAAAVLRRFSNGLPTVTIMHLVKERSRSAYTLGLIMVVLAFGIAIGANQQALDKLSEEVIGDQFQAPITVLSPSPIPPQTVATVRDTPGVGTVSELRFGNTFTLHDGDELWTGLVAIDPETYFEVQGFAWDEGDDDLALAALRAGGQTIIPSPMADALDVGVGDDLVLRTNDGPRPFRIAGLTRGFGGWEAHLSNEDAAANFGAGAPLRLLAGLDPGSDAEAVRSQLRGALGAGDQWGTESTFNVVGPDAFLADYRATIDGLVGVFLAVLFVALLAGLLGLANTLAMSVLQRSREIGVMRALGASPRQVAATVVVEAVVLTAAAYLLSIPVGVFLGVSTLTTMVSAAGFTATWAGLGPLVFVLGGLAALAAVVSGYLPARRASRTVIVDALRVE